MTPLLQLAGPLQAGFDQELGAEESLNVAIAVFALVLLALSVSAYRKTHLSRMLLVSAAFGLFAVAVVVNQLDLFIFTLGEGAERVITSLLDFVILLLFFLAVVRK